MRVARAMSRAQPASQVSAAAALVHEWHTNGIIMQEAGIAMTKQCDESGEEKGRQSSWLVWNSTNDQWRPGRGARAKPRAQQRRRAYCRARQHDI